MADDFSMSLLDLLRKANPDQRATFIRDAVERLMLGASRLFGLNTRTIRVPVSAEPCPCRGVVGTAG